MNHDLKIPVRPEPETTPLAIIAKRLTHRLRNPLSVITTAASQLQDRHAPILDSDDISLVDSIVIASEQIEAILKRFVLYACPEAPVAIPTDLNELCRNAIDRLVHEMAGDGGTEISFQPDHELPPISCDPDQIAIILSDLLENGLLAAGAQGEITIQTSHDSETVRIAVKDNGRGISAAHRQDSLTPFFTTWPGRNGLGLAIADRIIGRHKGSLELKACSGEGTEVIVTLPRSGWEKE